MNAPGHPAREVCAEQPWPPRYLTVTEAAAAMSRHRSAVLRLIHIGKLPSIRLGRSYRVREAEVLRLQRIGFEVRAELRAGASEPWVQLTRGQSEALELSVGAKVWLRAAPDASTLVPAASAGLVP